jgi:hypothetical protein
VTDLVAGRRGRTAPFQAVCAASGVPLRPGVSRFAPGPPVGASDGSQQSARPDHDDGTEDPEGHSDGTPPPPGATEVLGNDVLVLPHGDAVP